MLEVIPGACHTYTLSYCIADTVPVPRLGLSRNYLLHPCRRSADNTKCPAAHEDTDAGPCATTPDFTPSSAQFCKHIERTGPHDGPRYASRGPARVRQTLPPKTPKMGDAPFRTLALVLFTAARSAIRAVYLAGMEQSCEHHPLSGHGYTVMNPRTRRGRRRLARFVWSTAVWCLDGV